MIARLSFLLTILACFPAAAASKAPTSKSAVAKPSGDSKTGTKQSAAPNLDGVWRGFVVDGKGQQPDRGSTHLELTIEGNRIVGRRLDGQGGPLGEGTYTISPGKTLNLDSTELRKGGRARSYQGIGSVTGDTLKWCVATPGNPRPATFETKGVQYLLILKRQKEKR